MVEVRQHASGPRPSLDLPGFLRDQVRDVHQELDGYLNRWIGALELGSNQRQSTVPSLYLHAATVEDVTIHTLLLEEPPLFMTAWPGMGDAHYAPIDLDLIRNYAHNVYAATDAFMAALSLDAAGRRVDLSRVNLGRPTVAWVVSRFVVLELAHLGGELQSAAHGTGTLVHPCSDLYST